MRRLVVLGGSTPFTAGLVEALRNRADVPPHTLVLHGRDEGHLHTVGAYARHRLDRLGWSVQTGTGLGTVLDGADIVVHQIRYGNLEGRADDERFAHDHGCFPDETLGPGALRCLLRSLRSLRRTGEAIQKHAPDAWVVNLTNPLSATTSLLADHVGVRCLGICELPVATAREAAGVAGIQFGDVDWSYAGLNHRGFVYNIRSGGRNLLPDIVRSIGKGHLGGIAADTIKGLAAIPTKYFGLMSGSGPLYVGRAEEVANVRRRLASQLAADSARPPQSLGDRPTPWYDDSLVPILAALSSPQGGEVVATVPTGKEPAFERRGHLSWDGFVARIEPLPGLEVVRWVETYVRHERAVLSLLRNPSNQALHRAVALDPLVPDSKTDAVAGDLASLASG